MSLHDLFEILTLAFALGGGFAILKSEQKHLRDRLHEAVSSLSIGLKEVVEELRTVAVQESRITRLESDMKAAEGEIVQHGNVLSRLSGELRPLKFATSQ